MNLKTHRWPVKCLCFYWIALSMKQQEHLISQIQAFLRVQNHLYQSRFLAWLMVTDLDTCWYSVLWIIQVCWVVQWQTMEGKMRTDIAAYLLLLHGRINKQDLSVKPQDYREEIWIKMSHKYSQCLLYSSWKEGSKEGLCPTLLGNI